jgi:hypothetical protein
MLQSIRRFGIDLFSTGSTALRATNRLAQVGDYNASAYEAEQLFKCASRIKEVQETAGMSKEEALALLA